MKKIMWFIITFVIVYIAIKILTQMGMPIAIVFLTILGAGSVIAVILRILIGILKGLRLI
jgi:hypothetical protein